MFRNYGVTKACSGPLKTCVTLKGEGGAKTLIRVTKGERGKVFEETLHNQAIAVTQPSFCLNFGTIILINAKKLIQLAQKLIIVRILYSTMYTCMRILTFGNFSEISSFDE